MTDEELRAQIAARSESINRNGGSYIDHIGGEICLKRSRSYLRKQRARVIKRKTRIISDQYDYWHYSCPGSLAKGKIHCSCWLCRRKSYDMIGVHDERALFKQLSMLQDLEIAPSSEISRAKSYIRRKKI